MLASFSGASASAAGLRPVAERPVHQAAGVLRGTQLPAPPIEPMDPPWTLSTSAMKSGVNSDEWRSVIHHSVTAGVFRNPPIQLRRTAQTRSSRRPASKRKYIDS